MKSARLFIFSIIVALALAGFSSAFAADHAGQTLDDIFGIETPTGTAPKNIPLRKQAPPQVRRAPAQAAIAAPVPTPPPAQVASQGISFREWIDKTMGVFERTPVSIQLRRNIRLNDLSEESALLESPLSFGTTLKRTTAPRNMDLGEPHEVQTYSLSPNINYADNSGWAAAITAATDQNTYDTQFKVNSTDRGTTNNSKSFSLNVDIRKELLKEGGSDGTGSGLTQAKVGAITARSKRYTSEASLSEKKFQYYSLLTNLYEVECKILGLERQKKMVSDAIEVGKVQVSTRTISYEQYLQFIELENKFAREIVGEEQTRMALVQDALQWGGEVQRAAERFHEIKPDCVYNLDETIHRVEQSLLDEKDVDSLARSMPTYVAQDLSREAAELGLKATQLTNRPSLQALAGATYEKKPPLEMEIPTYSVGLQFTWRIPSKKVSVDEETARASIASAGSEVRATYFSNVSTIRKLQNEIQTQRAVIPILRRSLEASQKTLSIMATKRSIGEVDALGFAVSANNYNDAANALLNSWITLEQSLFQLNTLKQYFRPAARRTEAAPAAKPKGFELDL